MSFDIPESCDTAEIKEGFADADTLKLLAELEQELGVKGTTAVFRKSLALAKAARADAEREFGPLSDW